MVLLVERRVGEIGEDRKIRISQLDHLKSFPNQELIAGLGKILFFKGRVVSHGKIRIAPLGPIHVGSADFQELEFSGRGVQRLDTAGPFLFRSKPSLTF